MILDNYKVLPLRILGQLHNPRKLTQKYSVTHAEGIYGKHFILRGPVLATLKTSIIDSFFFGYFSHSKFKFDFLKEIEKIEPLVEELEERIRIREFRYHTSEKEDPIFLDYMGRIFGQLFKVRKLKLLFYNETFIRILKDPSLIENESLPKRVHFSEQNCGGRSQALRLDIEDVKHFFEHRKLGDRIYSIGIDNQSQSFLRDYVEVCNVFRSQNLVF